MTAKIKLNAASGGGSFSLQAPSSSANNRVMTLPDSADGTILTTTNPKAGNILQVLSSSKSDAQTINVSSTAAQDIIGTDQSGSGSVFCVKITPSSASSKILFTCSLTIGMAGGTSYPSAFMVRDSTVLLPSTHGTGNMQNATFGVSGTGSAYYIENINFTLLDSPNSTSELTYKVQLGKGDNSYITYINRPATLDNQPYNTCGSSTLTVMEVAV